MIFRRWVRNHRAEPHAEAFLGMPCKPRKHWLAPLLVSKWPFDGAFRAAIEFDQIQKLGVQVITLLIRRRKGILRTCR